MAATALTSESAQAGTRLLTGCALVLIAALYVVGIVSHGVVRHIVQTAPLWLAVALAKRGSAWSKWAALPCFMVWLLLMALIWLFLLGWTHVISGTFSAVEIAMTVIVGLCSATGIVSAIRTKTNVSAAAAFTLFALALFFQLVALRISFLPAIAHDHWW